MFSGLGLFGPDRDRCADDGDLATRKVRRLAASLGCSVLVLFDMPFSQPPISGRCDDRLNPPFHAIIFEIGSQKLFC
jgi:hypothetical protein